MISLSYAKETFSSISECVGSLRDKQFIAKLSNIKPLYNKLGYHINAAYKHMKEQKIVNRFSLESL